MIYCVMLVRVLCSCCYLFQIVVCCMYSVRGVLRYLIHSRIARYAEHCPAVPAWEIALLWDNIKYCSRENARLPTFSYCLVTVRTAYVVYVW